MSEARSRDSWIEAAMVLLAEGGVAAVKVEVLARRLGVTKGSFYWHFTDRADLLDAMLLHWRDTMTRRVNATVAARTAAPEAKLRQLWSISLSGRPETPGGRLEAALRQWALADPAVTKMLAIVDSERLEFTRQLYAQMGREPADAWSRLWYYCVIGCNTVESRDATLHEPKARAAIRALLGMP